jgi:hypothetical protein
MASSFGRIKEMVVESLKNLSHLIEKDASYVSKIPSREENTGRS